jgi:hypothetical protein
LSPALLATAFAIVRAGSCAADAGLLCDRIDGGHHPLYDLRHAQSQTERRIA